MEKNKIRMVIGLSIGLIIVMLWIVGVICTYISIKKAYGSTREEIRNGFRKKLKEVNPSYGEDLYKVTYAVCFLLSQFQSWESIRPDSDKADQGVDNISIAILLLQSIKIYQSNKELTELQRDALKEAGFDEAAFNKYSKDEIKKIAFELVRSSLVHGIEVMGLGFGGILKFFSMYATFDLFKSGMEAIDRQTVLKEIVSPTDPSLEVMNNEVQDSLFPRTRT
ncbi:hypothetical protein [Ehrlichia japonica]|uniref:Uncharacterized protein n=1 Tax=Ehrlichia japonica TaxID=391036 RepID=X5GJK4_9RICK|nr:hypothetical protein [Ehrlichia japonica]AHX04618.1 hypothetical protein EHF_0231 [Ehrlichia japonica]